MSALTFENIPANEISVWHDNKTCKHRGLAVRRMHPFTQSCLRVAHWMRIGFYSPKLRHMMLNYIDRRSPWCMGHAYEFNSFLAIAQMCSVFFCLWRSPLSTWKLKIKNRKIRKTQNNSYFLMSVATLYTLCFVMFCVFLYGPFCHGAHKLDLSTLFTTVFLWASLPFIFHIFMLKGKCGNYFSGRCMLHCFIVLKLVHFV